MKFVLAGCGGFIGNAMQEFLAQEAIPFCRLVRREPQDKHELFWDPAAGVLDARHLETATHIVNFSGAPIADALWTKRRKQDILCSRVDSTALLVSALNNSNNPGCTLLNASGVGFYGDCQNICTEKEASGTGFLAEVCEAWEEQLSGLDGRHRAVVMRLGIVLGKHGGPMARMLPPMQFGFGGRLGNGRQWMSWISLRDCIAAIMHCARVEAISGPVNIVNPEPVINKDFFATLAKVCNKPFWAHVPGWILRLRFGQMAQEILLSSSRVKPDVLLNTGFSYSDLELDSCFAHIIGEIDV